MPVRLPAALAAEDRGSAARVARAVGLLALLTVVVVGDKENLARVATLAQGSKPAEAST
jgi:hypothetical protein